MSMSSDGVELIAPRGKFRVVGVDKYDGTDWVEDDFGTANEALLVAQTKTTEARGKRSPSDRAAHSIATCYYAYDDRGHYLGGDTWVGE